MKLLTCASPGDSGCCPDGLQSSQVSRVRPISNMQSTNRQCELAFQPISPALPPAAYNSSAEHPVRSPWHARRRRGRRRACHGEGSRNRPPRSCELASSGLPTAASARPLPPGRAASTHPTVAVLQNTGVKRHRVISAPSGQQTPTLRA